MLFYASLWGGYADIKPFNHSWKPAFEKLNKDKNKYIIGYPELLYGGITPVKHRFLPDKSIYKDYETMKESEEQVFQDLAKHTPLLIGCGAFICRPYTPITTEWYEELHKRMDEACDALDNFNKTEENSFIYYDMAYPTKDKGYPIPFFYLLGQIFHPLQLKYHKHTLRDKKLLPILKDYR